MYDVCLPCCDFLFKRSDRRTNDQRDTTVMYDLANFHDMSIHTQLTYCTLEEVIAGA